MFECGIRNLHPETDGHFRHLVRGAALNSLGYHFPGPGLALLLHPGLHLFDLEGGLVGDFRFHLVDEVLLRLLGGEAGGKAGISAPSRP